MDFDTSVQFAILGRALGEQQLELSEQIAKIGIIMQSDELIEGTIGSDYLSAGKLVTLSLSGFGDIAIIQFEEDPLPPPISIDGVEFNMGALQPIPTAVGMFAHDSVKVVVKGENVGYGRPIVSDNRLVVTNVYAERDRFSCWLSFSDKSITEDVRCWLALDFNRVLDLTIIPGA